MSHIDEILAEIDGVAVESSEEESTLTPEPAPALEATEWEQDADSEGNLMEGKYFRQVPFSEKFGYNPSSYGIPDHLVWEFSGWDCSDMSEYSDYVTPEKELAELSFFISQKAKVMIVGPTGAGKTLNLEYYSTSCGRPWFRIEHNDNLEKTEAFGRVDLKDGEVDFLPGTLPLSMAMPAILILDEWSRAPGFTNIIYQRVLDRNECLLPEMRNGALEPIKPHWAWVPAATDNTKGNGDGMDKYIASNVQDQATINRFDFVLEQDYMDINGERNLIKKFAPSMNAKNRNSLSRFSDLIHSGFKKGEISTAFSPRNLSAICGATERGMELKQAIEYNYVSRVSEADISDVKECLRSVFGGAK